MIDEDGAGRHGCEGPIGAEGDLAHVGVVADAGEDDVLSAGGFRRSCRRTPAVAGDPALGLGRAAIVNGDLVAGPREMACHRKSHHAQSEKCRLHHHRTSSNRGRE